MLMPDSADWNDVRASRIRRRMDSQIFRGSARLSCHVMGGGGDQLFGDGLCRLGLPGGRGGDLLADLIQ